MNDLTLALASPDVLLAREALLREMYASADRWEADRYDEFVSPDVAFRFGNAPEARGREVIAGAMTHMRDLVSEIQHDVERMIHGPEGHVTAEINMHYVRHDGAELRVPAAVIFHFDPDGLVDRYRIFIDTGDFFA